MEATSERKSCQKNSLTTEFDTANQSSKFSQSELRKRLAFENFKQRFVVVHRCLVGNQNLDNFS